MKRIFTMLVLVLIAMSFSACGSEKPAQDCKIKVVTTIFPVYDWTREIIGENKEFDLMLLMDKGIDLHSFQPSAEDMLKVSECDVFIYVGGESDEWVSDAIKNATNKDMVVVNLMEVLGDKVKPEEHVEGMEEHHEHEEESENDEHIWLSLKNAQILCNTINDALSKVTPSKADTFKKILPLTKKNLSRLTKNIMMP